MARIAFVQNLYFEYLGLMYLSSILKKNGHQVEIFIPKESKTSKIFIDDLKAFNPDLVGFYCTTGAQDWALKCAGIIKQATSSQTIFGGPHPTYFPEIINEQAVDIVCRGEGEYPLLDICNKIDSKEDFTTTLSCWFKKEGSVLKNEQRCLVEDLDLLPFPDRELYSSKYPYFKKSQKVFMASRGCPFNCTFCFNHKYKELYRGKGKFVRYRSVDNIMMEIMEVKHQAKEFRTVYMQDDTFILDKDLASAFAKRYAKEINLPFVCLVRADLVDESIIRNLCAANCKSVFFGVETGSEKLRNSLLKKGVTDEQIFQTARLLKKYGIKFRTYNMLGLPGETLEDAYKTVDINIKIKTDYPWCSLFSPLPGTQLGEYAEKYNMLETTAHNTSSSFFKTSSLKSEYKNEFINLQKFFLFIVKFPWLSPVIKKIIKWKPNPLFETIFLAGYAWSYMKSENLSLREVWGVGIRNFKTFFFGANSID